MNLTKQIFENTAACNSAACMKERQEQLKLGYAQEPERARITDIARTSSDLIPATTALYSEVIPGHHALESYAVGVHRSVGGMSDYATPGDILCAAIASCLDSTLRIIANRLAIPLKSLSVCVKASADVRGTLCIEKSVPVGFQKFEIQVDLKTMMRLPKGTLATLMRAAEHSCVVMQTLKNPPSITLNHTPAGCSVRAA